MPTPRSRATSRERSDAPPKGAPIAETRSADAPADRAIEVEGASTHNLVDVTCRIPHGRITVVTGVSGSGKSSLAFDTVYAEGQRRYVETLSTYARQFLQQMRKPPVRSLRNMLPSLALRQGNPVNNARSSVGTVTELNDHLHVLFARAGSVVCKACGADVVPWTVPVVVRALRDDAAGERILLLAEVRPDGDDSIATLLRQLAAEGHRRVWHGNRMVEIDTEGAADLLGESSIWLVIDRLQVDADDPRLPEAVERAFGTGERVLRVIFWDRGASESTREERTFSPSHRCDACGTVHATPSLLLFNPQSALGKCSTCDGFGRTVGLDPALVVPNPAATLEGGAVTCLESAMGQRARRNLLRAVMDRGWPVDVPWIDLPEEARHYVFHGGDGWYGVRGFFRELEEDRHKAHVRIFVARFRGYTECERCGGSGLSDDARAVRIAGRSLATLQSLRIEELVAWLGELHLGGGYDEALEPLLREMRERLVFLDDAGAGYLTLGRAARTLSGGEMHRVVLATSVGRALTDTCYVLDEPTAGLHPADTERLFRVVERLRDAGNTVVVVEHDPDVIRGADHVIEMGPDAGERGGRVCFEGSVSALLAHRETTTGRLLADRTSQRSAARPPASEWLEVRDACLNNLRRVHVAFAKRRLNVVTGVSGSGKSTLVSDVLHGLLREKRGQQAPHLAPASLHGDHFADIVLVDQGAMPRSTRSCALTVSGAYTPLRELFAQQPLAIERGYAAGAFSFNTPGGRCDACDGTGVVTVEMHFLADIELACEICDGTRFQRTLREVTWEGLSIADVFQLTVSEALQRFASVPTVARRLEPLETVGLGYLRLGQTTSRMSGGELQRLKLSTYLGSPGEATNELLFLFDEPTVGLHMRDVDVLVGALQRLVDAGHTVIVVEHNLDLIASADHVIDLGPGAGPRGGRVVHAGTVEELRSHPESRTGAFLRASFGER